MTIRSILALIIENSKKKKKKKKSLTQLVRDEYRIDLLVDIQQKIVDLETCKEYLQSITHDDSLDEREAMFKHIPVIPSNHRLVSKRGLRLKVFLIDLFNHLFIRGQFMIVDL